MGDDRVDRFGHRRRTGSARTWTLRRVRAIFRRALVLNRCGHTSAATAPASTAERTEARATIRIRFAVFAAIDEPSSLRPSRRSMSATPPGRDRRVSGSSCPSTSRAGCRGRLRSEATTPCRGKRADPLEVCAALDRECDEPGECLGRRCPSSGNATPAIARRANVATTHGRGHPPTGSDTIGLAGRFVEPAAVLHRLQQQASVAVGLDAGADDLLRCRPSIVKRTTQNSFACTVERRSWTPNTLTVCIGRAITDHPQPSDRHAPAAGGSLGRLWEDTNQPAIADGPDQVEPPF